MLIITGTGRCGTGYVSLVVTKTGATRCGHENLYNLNGRVKKPRFDVEVESSWLAAPFVQDNDFVVQIVRNPVDCIASLVGVPGLFIEPLSPYGRFIRKHCPESESDNPIASASRFYVLWNKRIEKIASERWNVERLEPDRLAGVLSRQGFDVDLAAAKNAIDGIPHTHNTSHNRLRPSLSWLELQSSLEEDDFSGLVEMAAEYGYLKKRRLRVGET